jgi:hypothetical protein
MEILPWGGDEGVVVLPLAPLGPKASWNVGGLRCRLEHASRNQCSYRRDSAEHKGVDKPLGQNHHAPPGSNYSLPSPGAVALTMAGNRFEGSYQRVYEASFAIQG